MPSCNTYSAEIRSGNKGMQEYQVKCDEYMQEATCWIAAENNQEFSIHVERLKPNQRGWTCDLYVDGKEVELPSLNMSDDETSSMTYALRRDPYSGIRKYYPMSFTLRTQKPEDESSTRRWYKAGSLELVIYECDWIREPGRAPKPRDLRLDQKSEYGEKVKMGVDYGVKFADTAIGQESAGDDTYHAENRELVARFTFKYRSLAVLQAFDLAPPQLNSIGTDLESAERRQRIIDAKAKLDKATEERNAAAEILRTAHDEDEAAAEKQRMEAIIRDKRRTRPYESYDRIRSMVEGDVKKRKVNVIDLASDAE